MNHNILALIDNFQLIQWADYIEVTNDFVNHSWIKVISNDGDRVTYVDLNSLEVKSTFLFHAQLLNLKADTFYVINDIWSTAYKVDSKIARMKAIEFEDLVEALYLARPKVFG
jgi:hypothetical protein